MNSIINSAFYQDVNKAYCPMTRDEEYECIHKAKAGDNRAQNKLINAQLKRIIAIARSYSNHINTVEELTSEGTIGLVKAIEIFDFSKAGTMRFHSYAQWWIREHIVNVVCDNQLIRLPRNQSKCKKEVRDENGKVIKERQEGVRVNSVSINAPVSEDSNAGIFEMMIPDKTSLSADTLVEYTKMMGKLTAGLEPRELEMFEARVFDECSYDDIATLFGLNSREVVRQHLNKIFAKAQRICKK